MAYLPEAGGKSIASTAVGQPLTLQSRQDFLHAQQRGRRFKRKHVVILVITNSIHHARIGYTVSRKVGCAVLRNRVRRRLREIVRAHASSLRPGFDYVIVAFAEAAEADFSTLREEVTCLLAQVGRYQPSA